jgi:pimeloyl-ACP methyl ester carboxylesterase
MRGRRRALGAVVLVCASAGTLAPAASAKRVTWSPCGDAPSVTCARISAPLSYRHPNGRQIKLFVARSKATGDRVGTLFFNFGGPGGTAADAVEAAGADLFPALGEHYDIVGMDPRGVGQSTPSIDCKVDQETDGIYSQPFTTPDNVNPSALIRKDLRYIARCGRLNGDILAHVSTANVARDINLIRRVLGEDKISYLGFSYGTFLGATFASMFPDRYRRMVLDGPLDADSYVNEPMDALSSQSDGFERALAHFLQACARDQTACAGFGGDDPQDALDELVARANAAPLPASGDDPRPVDGDDVLAGTVVALYNKFNWPFLARALAAADNDNDGTALRILADAFYARNDDGSYDPISDRYFTIGATEQQYPRRLSTYFKAGKRSWTEHWHTFWNNGYDELNYGLYPYRDRDAYLGPFRIPDRAATPLVVATTYDPATTYRGALNLVRDERNARLLKVRGDGHTAYGNGSPCADSAIETYLITGALPPAGTVCTQEVPFEQSAARTLGVPQLSERLRLHMRPM